MNEKLGIEQSLEKAKSVAMYYLSHRARTEHQLKMTLRKKLYTEDVIEKVCDFCKQYEWLNDNQFALRYIENKMKHQGKGRQWIIQSLLQKGIEKSTIEQALQLISETDEYEQLCEYIMKKQFFYEKSDQRLKQKIFNHLMRRGYTIDLINRAFQDIDFS
jgi:regulatory protein